MGEIKKAGRLTELDALRGIAALGVVFYHYFWHYNQLFVHTFNPPTFFKYLWLGVPLFFIISGFVIFWTLSRSKTLLDFVVSRFSRLYPVFWVSATITFVWVQLWGPSIRAVNLEAYFVNLTMFQEFLHFPHVDGVYWTLSIELEFYILMGVVFYFRLLRRPAFFLLPWLAASVFVNWAGIDVGIFRQVFILHWCHLFMAGVCFFRCWNGRGNWLYYVMILISAVANFFIFPFVQAVIVVGGYCVFWLAINKKLAFLEFSIFRFLGAISYSLYLVHQNVGYSIIMNSDKLGMGRLVSVPIALLVSLLVATVLNKFIEKPALIFIRERYALHRLKVAGEG